MTEYQDRNPKNPETWNPEWAVRFRRHPLQSRRIAKGLPLRAWAPRQSLGPWVLGYSGISPRRPVSSVVRASLGIWVFGCLGISRQRPPRRPDHRLQGRAHPDRKRGVADPPIRPQGKPLGPRLRGGETVADRESVVVPTAPVPGRPGGGTRRRLVGGGEFLPEAAQEPGGRRPTRRRGGARRLSAPDQPPRRPRGGLPVHARGRRPPAGLRAGQAVRRLVPRAGAEPHGPDRHGEPAGRGPQQQRPARTVLRTASRRCFANWKPSTTAARSLFEALDRARCREEEPRPRSRPGSPG